MPKSSLGELTWKMADTLSRQRTVLTESIAEASSKSMTRQLNSELAWLEKAAQNTDRYIASTQLRAEKRAIRERLAAQRWQRNLTATQNRLNKSAKVLDRQRRSAASTEHKAAVDLQAKTLHAFYRSSVAEAEGWLKLEAKNASLEAALDLRVLESLLESFVKIAGAGDIRPIKESFLELSKIAISLAKHLPGTQILHVLFILKSATESFSRKNAFRSGDRVLALSEARTMGLEHLAKVADDLSKL